MSSKHVSLILLALSSVEISMDKLRLHVISLPHTNTTDKFMSCAYTQKVRKFCKMMHDRGHTVYLYSGEKNDAPCHEHIPCVSESFRKRFVDDTKYTSFPWGEGALWNTFNSSAAMEIAPRIHKNSKDFICSIGGRTQESIARQFPNNAAVEFGIGYSGTFANFRVWESYAWMHTVYGKQSAEPMKEFGKWYDAVIPNYYDIEDFPFVEEPKANYFLYLGRMIDDKGVMIASDVCKHLGAKIIFAGGGNLVPDYGKHVGMVDKKMRGVLLANAKAVFAPSKYLEPFGGAAVEAQLCGTPVITSDWGGFTETVQPGVTGWRCRTMKEFVWAAQNLQDFDRGYIRNEAQARYGLNTVASQYEQFFERLLGLHGEGWTAL
jgi:glycosyltransferase involved in cell wall biosynthesis